ncbi:MAG: response regulator [Candidatus Omnitrophica bacterium]|nr:response regulator [Candidatus Omnitrophota bacterium]
MERSVLLVDDEASMRDLLGRVLERRQATVWKAGNGEEALELFSVHRPQVVLLDVKLPGMEGPQILTKMKEISPDARIFFLTGAEDSRFSSPEKVEALGADGCFLKPVDIDELLRTVFSPR